jgi:hypothetical protein
MRGLIGKMSLVTMEGPGTFVGEEMERNPAQYDLTEMLFKCECATECLLVKDTKL